MPDDPSSSPRYRKARAAVAAVGVTAQQATAGVERFLHELTLAQHRPIELEPGELVCSNHWTHRPRSWPCDTVIREQDRWAQRQRATDTTKGTHAPGKPATLTLDGHNAARNDTGAQP